MTAVGQEFWVVAAKANKDADKTDYHDQLVRHPALANRGGVAPVPFNVPDGDRSLSFGSFDGLIRLTDDLQKSDSQLDAIVHRLERQYLEIEPKAQFMVKSQRQEISFEKYISTWNWDEARYPRTRSIADNLTSLMSVVMKFDEECRNKTAQYNETKTAKANIAKKDGANLTARDLVDVLTPQVMKQSGTAADKFISTEHLTTVVVIIPRGGDAEFLKLYEKREFSEECFGKVVPMSAMKFQGLDDKDGNMLWRFVMFKSVAEAFKKACRLHKVVPRDFEYSEDAHKKLIEQRESLEESSKRQLERVRGLYMSAWSDSMVAWIHVKAMRVFVESVLRFGLPPSFAAFIIQPRSGTPKERRALADILGKGDQAATETGDDGEEFFPYVSFGFTPFTVARI